MNTLIFLASVALTCPPVIGIKQEVMPEQGWVVHAPQIPHKFYFAQFSDGPPDRQVILMHDNESRSGRDKVLQYQFLPSQEPWLVCSYTGTGAVLARKLPVTVRSCRLSLDHAHNHETVSEIRCE
jgi:hypothetical protein